MSDIHRARRLALATLAVAALCSGCAVRTFAPEGPARSDALFSRVDLGMTQQDVRALLGPPDETMPLRARTLAWDYRFQDTWGYFAVFSVTFDVDGRAVSRLTWRINDGGDHS